MLCDFLVIRALGSPSIIGQAKADVRAAHEANWDYLEARE